MPTPSSPTPQAFEDAKAFFLQGLADLQAGRTQAAEAAFEASLVRVPGRISTLVNLAATRMVLGRLQEALATTDQVLQQEPANADALLHRAEALRRLARPGDAAAAYAALLAQRPSLAEPWLRQGQCLLDLNRPHEALQSFDRALALDATLAAAWSCRADVLRDMGRLDEARQAYRQALQHGADAELIGYCLAALGGGPAPQTAPRAYVETLFDAYAGDFEQHVVQVLRYRAHERLAAPLGALHPARFASALDLGCGTGLCGPLLRPWVDRLVGVDLSHRMLDQARGTGVYDELLHADVLQHLQRSRGPIDLVVAADVFIYVGALDEVFAQVARLMPPGGIFCFSAEQAQGVVGDAGFELLPSLRYAHDEGDLRRLAARHGFEVARLVHETVREEQRRPIAGMFVHLRRNG
jgi:predicted TPR repeat methyltransferase